MKEYSIRNIGFKNYLKLMPNTLGKKSKKCAAICSRAIVFMLLYIVILIILGIIT
ncbi:MAG: hypothetical protein Q8920_08575 [Bacillota bacterium]|nr:hypothetical protein [Bacillota bacterium]